MCLFEQILSKIVSYLFRWISQLLDSDFFWSQLGLEKKKDSI